MKKLKPINRRNFLTGTVGVGAAIGAIALGLKPQAEFEIDNTGLLRRDTNGHFQEWRNGKWNTLPIRVRLPEEM